MMSQPLETPGFSTDPTGRCFVSYRRSHADDIARIVDAMLDHGVPPWQDRRNLGSEPLVPGLKEALMSPDTAGCLVWVTRGFSCSPVVARVELPLIRDRSARDDTFFTELWLADGMDYPEAAEHFRPTGTLDDVSASWNVKRARTMPCVVPDGLAERIDNPEATRIALELLKRRLSKLHARLSPGEPIRLLLNAHAEAGETFVSGFGIQLNWARHYQHRFVDPNVWSGSLLPALANLSRAVRAAAPGRPIAAQGPASLAACLALGRTFREVTGIPLSWTQHPSWVSWDFAEAEVDSEFAPRLRDLHVDGDDLAVLVSVTADVEPALEATVGLPRFRAILTIRPRDGSSRRELPSAGHATHLARMIVGAIREARRDLRTISRIHFFFAGPAGLAVLVGQLLNALGPVQSYEHVQNNGVGSYRLAALLTDPENPV